MRTTTRRDRYRGAMVGTLFGDAMGAPVEWWTPPEIAEYSAKIGGLHLHDYLDPWAARRGKTPTLVSAGQPTDDSELAAALAQSLVAHPDLDQQDLYGRLRSFIHGRKAVLSNRAYGMGGTLKASLEPATYEESLAKFAAGAVPTPPSNGSLMRSVSVSLLAGANTDLASILATKQSMVTHRNSESVAACVAFNTMLCHVLDGREPGEAWDLAYAELSAPLLAPPNLFTGYDNILRMPLTKPDYEAEIKGKEGWAVLSLRVAVWAAAGALDFLEGIERAISVGGDTDTYAAIAGGILGAKFGYEHIPVGMIEKLQGKEIMLGLADRLYEIAIQ